MMYKKNLFDKYLDLLGVEVSSPSFEFLCRIVRAHLLRIPFENVSKLLYKKEGMDDIPDLSTYLNGIEKYNFGGTCYANNHYLNLLLNHLCFDVKLCSADMKNPDVHIINIVTVEGGEYIVDGGYAAPFLKPLPRFLTGDYVLSLGPEKFILKPQDKNGLSKLEHYYNGEFKHWYTAKPKPRTIEEFSGVIKDSYSDDAMFMNIFRITRFTGSGSLVLRNLQLTETTGSLTTTIEVPRNEIPGIVEAKFSIPADVAKEALGTIKDFKNTFD
jgi:arylamine N-acetyltransferase